MRLARVCIAGFAAGAGTIGCASMDGRVVDRWKIEPTVAVRHGLDATNAQGFFALGLAYQGEGRWEQAAEAFLKAALNDPDDARAHNGLGISLGVLGRHDSAVAAFERAASLDPLSAQYRNNLGFALLLDGRPASAKQQLKAALLLEPGHTLALENLGRADEALASAARASAAAEVAAAPTGASPEAAMPVAAEPAKTDEPAPAAARTVALEQAPTVAALEVRAPRAEPLALQIAGAAPPAPAAPSRQEEPAGSAAPVLAPQERLRDFRLEVANGNGVEGAAARLRSWLATQGVTTHRLSNQRPFATAQTTVHYQPGWREQALALAQRLPAEAQVVEAEGPSIRAEVKVVIGHDVRRTASCGDRWPCATVVSAAR